MKPVITIGEIVAEIMAVDVGEGFRSPLRLIGPYPSGAPAIFIDQVAKIGLPCAIISAVGNDDFGWLSIDRLRSDGVDISAIRIDNRLATGSAFVRYRSTGERDFVFNIVGSACSTIRRDAAASAVIASAGHIHVMGSSLFSPAVVSLVEDAITEIKARGGTVSFDPNGRKEMLDVPGMRDALARVLAQTDLFLPSGEELTLLTRAHTDDGAIAELLGAGIRSVVVKQGAAGATYHDRERTCRVAPMPVNEVDPTGAGDSFGGTFVACWLLGLPPEQCLRFANASGARAVMMRGPMEGNSTLAELETFLSVDALGANLWLSMMNTRRSGPRN
nr:sugar kinase [Beijerinckia indica]